MNIENIQKKIKRTYRKDKPKFFAIIGGSVAFLFLIALTINKAGNSIDTSHGEQVVQLGQGNKSVSKPKDYVSIYDFKVEPLKLNPQRANGSSNSNAGNSASKVMNNVYKISAPNIDGLALGQRITAEDVKKLGFEVGAAIPSQPTLFNATKVGNAYNIYGVDGATFSILSNGGKLNSLIFNWSQVEARVLMKNIMDTHSINLSAINCAVVSVPESSQPKAKLINTEMCTLRAISQGLSLEVSTLPALKTGTVAFNYINP